MQAYPPTQGETIGETTKASQPSAAARPPHSNPLQKYPRRAIEKATALREAFAQHFNARHGDAVLTQAEIERRGVEDYRREIGHLISPRHWRRLLERIVQNDGGKHEFGRLELYVFDRRPARPTASRGKCFGLDFADLQGWINSLADFNNPTSPERDSLWRSAFDLVEMATSEGVPHARAKRLTVGYLWHHGPRLATTASALWRSFERKYVKWLDTNQVADGRIEANKQKRAPLLEDWERDLLVQRAVFGHNGYLPPAWRQCYPSLSEQIRARYSRFGDRKAGGKGTRKAYCPKAIYHQVAGEIRMLMPHHRGPRQARLAGACLQRDWSGLFAGDSFSTDDKTLEIYYAVPAEPGGKSDWRAIRGQYFPFVDERSKKILSHILTDSSAPVALEVRCGLGRTMADVGIPRRFIKLECGFVFKKSRLLGGGEKVNPWAEASETFATRLGIRIRHSLPGNPRGKIVENILALLTRRFPDEAMFVGRCEQEIKYERVQAAIRDVNEGRKHPHQVGMLFAKEWDDRLEKIGREYNAEVQESRVIGGNAIVSMSPDDAWEKLQPRNAAGKVISLDVLPKDLKYLLWHKEVRPVTRNGIRLKIGRVDYLYRGEATGELVGQPVMVWFDPEQPTEICITDMRGENVRTVPKAPDPLPVYDATPEEMRVACASVNAQNSYAKLRYRLLASTYNPPVRPILADPAAVDKGRQMQEQRAETRRELAANAKRDAQQLDAERQADLEEREARARAYEMEHFLECL
jgi:hypothetical protein